MNEFRVASDNISDRRRERRARLFLWGIVLALSVITLFAVLGYNSASRQLNTTLAGLVVLMVGGAIVCAHFLAFRHGVETVENEIVFELSDEDLVRKRHGYPDVRIRLSEINALYAQHGWLVIESVEPRRTIAVPEKVERFSLLRAQLAKHSPIIVAPQRLALGFVPAVAYAICWGVVLWSKDALVAEVAAISGLTLLGWESVRLYRQLRDSPRRHLMWALVGLGWLATALVFYVKFVRG
jgi:hypothetical protein